MSVYQELGAKLRDFMLDKTEEVDDKVEAINKHERYVNTDLDYCHLTFDESAAGKSLAVNTILPFTKVIGTNMDVNTDTYSISLKAGKTYQILSDFYSGVKDFMAYFDIVDKTNDVKITRFCKATINYNGICTSTIGNAIYKPETDCEICVQVNQVSGALSIASDPVNLSCSFLTVNEINRQIVIDPIEHVNDSQGIEDTPVGHIIAHMGTVAPKHYLICDGTEYNIADYPYLAQHIEDNFGSINFFGGNGETTFAVPDLRGEFLRGTGTGTRDTGSGANVGQHQNGTIMPNIWLYHNTNQKWQLQAEVDPDVPFGLRIANGDKYYAPTGSTRFNLAYGELNLNKYTGVPDSSQITVRPTNTSVLYCIKYEPTYFMNTYNTNYLQPSMYSEEEKVIGCWIDGKPIYQKTITGTFDVLTKNIDISELNIDTITNMFGMEKGYYANGEFIDSSYLVAGIPNGVEGYFNMWIATNYLLGIKVNDEARLNAPYYITIQYTKTTDEENSFTVDMIKDSFTELTYTDEEIYNEVANILSSESNKGE